MRKQNHLDHFEILEKVGYGQYGEVFKVRHTEKNKIYALKKIRTSECHTRERIRALHEVKALKLLQHPSIVRYFDSFLSPENLYIVFEFASGGDLARHVETRRIKNNPFSEEELWNMFEQISNGVKFLHENKMIHRDLKLENILLTKERQLKISDLGLIKLAETEGFSQRVGTPIYFAPELIRHEIYSYSIDIWALGCMFYNLTTLEHPFYEATLETLPYFVLEKPLKPIRLQYSPILIKFIHSILEKNVSSRPNIYEILKSIKEKNKIQIENKITVYELKHILELKEIELVEMKKMKKSEVNEMHINKNNLFKSSRKIYSSNINMKNNDKVNEGNKTTRISKEVQHKNNYNPENDRLSPIKSSGFTSIFFPLKNKKND